MKELEGDSGAGAHSRWDHFLGRLEQMNWAHGAKELHQEIVAFVVGDSTYFSNVFCIVLYLEGRLLHHQATGSRS